MSGTARTLGGRLCVLVPRVNKEVQDRFETNDNARGLVSHGTSLPIAPRRCYTGLMKALLTVILCGISIIVSSAMDADGKLRIIAFGAHPDDCELQAGGTA